MTDDMFDIEQTSEDILTEDDEFVIEDEDEPGDDGTDDAEENQEDDDVEDGEDTPDQPEKETSQEPQKFILKHLDKELEVSLEDMQAYAQKGLDYDRIREGYEEYKNLKDPLSELKDLTGKEIGDFVNAYKEEQYAKDIAARKQEIMANEIVSDELAERMAKAEIANERAEKAKTKQQTQEATHDDAEQQKLERMREVDELVRLCPELQKEGASLPDEVVKAVQENNIPLTVAYLDWSNRQKNVEIEQLKLEAKNAKKNPGSLKGSFAKEKGDPDDLMEGLLDF